MAWKKMRYPGLKCGSKRIINRLPIGDFMVEFQLKNNNY